MSLAGQYVVGRTVCCWQDRLLSERQAVFVRTVFHWLGRLLLAGQERLMLAGRVVVGRTGCCRHERLLLAGGCCWDEGCCWQDGLMLAGQVGADRYFLQNKLLLAAHYRGWMCRGK